MKNKKNIIQFMPYFPPHKWWLETHWEQWWNWWVKKKYWKVYNIITNFNQNYDLWEKVVFENNIIWYKKNGVENLIVPSLEIINNFPIYKFWTKEYKLIIKYLKNKNIDRIITRTRFFLTSFIWWVFARKKKIEWWHIEHWSDYVKLNSWLKNIIAKIYDKLIWKWIFKKADKVIWVSEACKQFIKKEFVDRKVEVIYRGLDLPKKVNSNILKVKFTDKIIIWFVWRLYKWKNIDSLIKAYYLLDEGLKDKIQIVIIGEWEDFERLNYLDSENKIYFTWWKSFDDAIKLQSQFDIHFHTSSPWGWLATTLLQAMSLGCFIVATTYEWADEVIKNWKNWILLNDDSVEQLTIWLEKWIKLIWKKEEFALVNRKNFDEKFSWAKNIEKYKNLFE